MTTDWIKRGLKVNKEMMAELPEWAGGNGDLIKALEVENAELRGVLAWYRDAQYDPALSDDIHDDKGQRARDALKIEE